MFPNPVLSSIKLNINKELFNFWMFGRFCFENSLADISDAIFPFSRLTK